MKFDFTAGEDFLRNTAMSEFGNPAAKTLFEQEEIEVETFKNALRIGKRADGKDYFISLKEIHRQVLVGKTRCGKTFNMRRMSDLFYHSGYAVIHLCDLFNEMITSNQPSQAKYQRFLPKGEFPIGIPVKAYRPAIFKDLPQGNIKYQLGWGDLTEADIMIFCGIDGRAVEAQTAILQNFPKATGLIHFINLIKNEKIRAQTKNRIITKLQFLIDYEFIGDKWNADIIEDMEQGNVVVIHLEGYKKWEKSSPYLYQLPVINILRRIAEARKTGKLSKRTVIFIDEAAKMIPKRKEGELKEEILDNVDMTAKLGIFMIFASQLEDGIPDSILDQSRYLWFPYSINSVDAVNLLARKQHYDFHPAYKRDLLRQLLDLKPTPDGRLPWVIIDDTKKTVWKVFPYPPLSNHKESL